MDPRVLLPYLHALLGIDAGARRGAEAFLSEASRQPGYCLGLLGIAFADAAPGAGGGDDEGIRQLAMVLLKNHMGSHWTSESENFREPQVLESEKAALRGALPEGLASPSSKLRTATAVAIARIAAWDCPEQWPELLDGLVGDISCGGDVGEGRRVEWREGAVACCR